MKSLDKLIARFSLRLASNVLIVLPLCFLFFHALIIAEILPRNIVWGGRLTDQTLLPLEILAMAINLLLMLIGGVASGIVKHPAALFAANRIKWFLFYFVVVNTILALFSTTTFELLLTPTTALYALCLYRINRFSDGLGSAPAAKT